MLNKDELSSQWFESVTAEPGGLLDIIKRVAEVARDSFVKFGCDHADEVEQILFQLVDEIVAWDNPAVPDWAESWVDNSFEQTVKPGITGLKHLLCPAKDGGQ